MSNTLESARLLLDQLHDERSRRVVLVSHCLLNENTRYAGGATRPGAVAEIIDELIAKGYGIHQLPCPERLAWGGVLKRHSLRLYHSKGRPSLCSARRSAKCVRLVDQGHLSSVSHGRSHVM